MLLDAQKHKNPSEAKINYYKCVEAPTATDPTDFTVVREHAVYFCPSKVEVKEDGEEEAGAEAEGGDKKASTLQTTAATLLPTSSWVSHCLAIVFVVKWSPNGLTPVRPQVILTADVDIPPGCCLQMF